MKCQSCGMQKHSVTGYKSKLIPDMNIIMCDMCRSKGYEPRHIIILAMLGNHSPDATRAMISGHKYAGKAILASEIIRL